MRKNFGAKPFLYPQPVMILGTYDENGKANAMNAAYSWLMDTATSRQPSTIWTLWMMNCLMPARNSMRNIPHCMGLRNCYRRWFYACVFTIFYRSRRGTEQAD